jgi:hypothetical protein
MSNRHWWGGKKKPQVEWTDPLNPHGDGTLREGDTIFDAMMRGNVMIGNFGSDGWVFEEKPRDPGSP